MASDSVRQNFGPLEEIEWLRNNRSICDNNSAITRRLSLRLMELGDNQYGDDGIELDVNKKELFIESLDWARIAVQEDSTDDINYENLSMAFAARISVAGLKGKSVLADSVRIYAEKAVEINPDNHRAYHILGRWHYEVSKLSWILRRLSKLVFRHSPSGSFQLAVDYFNKAINLNNIPVHHYWLGMSYLESGRKDEALERFRYLLDLNDDCIYNATYFKERAQELIDKHG
jgi:tetratricopeptide (TPR) repeat protein